MTDVREALERLLRQRSRGGEGWGFNADMHEEEVVERILATTSEACRDAVIDSTERLIVAFRRFSVARFGIAPTEDEFRAILKAARDL